jgi:hypothetical protein
MKHTERINGTESVDNYFRCPQCGGQTEIQDSGPRLLNTILNTTFVKPKSYAVPAPTRTASPKGRRFKSRSRNQLSPQSTHNNRLR